MGDSVNLPIFFAPDENLSAAERIERKRREQAEIIRSNYRIRRLDGVKSSATVEAYQIRCLDKRLVHLEREKAQTELQLSTFNATVHRQAAESYRKQIMRLLDEVATYEAKIASAKIDMSELNSQINRATVEKKISAKAVTSEFTYAEELGRSCRELEAMENRLHQARLLEGKLHSENRESRGKIEDMLVERKRYNQMCSVYVQQLGRNRKFLIDMTERATLAFNQGEDLCYRIEALKTQNQREQGSRAQEMLELDRQIVGVREINEFFRAKGFARPVAAVDRKLVRKRDLFKNEHREQIRSFGSIIRHTRKSLNVETIHHALFEIEKQQEKYIALFRYINITNGKIEEANAVASDLEKQSQNLQDAERRKLCSDGRKTKQDVQRLQNSRQQTATMQADIARQQVNLHSKLSIIEHALSFVGFDREQIIQLMVGSNISDSSQLNRCNLRFLLATTERRVLEMIRKAAPAVPSTVDEEDIATGAVYGIQQCAECAEGQDVNQHDERIVVPATYDQLLENVRKRSEAPEHLYRLHTLSQCKLPRSRMLVNKRYQ